MYLEIWKSNKKKVINLEQEEFFNYLEKLEEFYEKGFITLVEYYKIKSRIVDYFIEQNR